MGPGEEWILDSLWVIEEWRCRRRCHRRNPRVDAARLTAGPSSRRSGAAATSCWIGKRCWGARANASCITRRPITGEGSTSSSSSNCYSCSVSTAVAANAFSCTCSPNGEATCAPSSGESPLSVSGLVLWQHHLYSFLSRWFFIAINDVYNKAIRRCLKLLSSISYL